MTAPSDLTPMARHDTTHRRVLITGPSGSGKTTLSARMSSRGFSAYDADKIPGLTGWFDLASNRVQFPFGAGREFLDQHRFFWDRNALVSFLSTRQEVYVFGISRNAMEMLDLFDFAFFLDVPPATLVSRLRSPERDNPMGQTDYQLEYSLYWADVNRAKAIANAITLLDGTESPDAILDFILNARPRR